MSVKDFYNAVTPGSTISHGIGRGVYTKLRQQDIRSETFYEQENLPTTREGRNGLLNRVKKNIFALFANN